MTNSINRRQAMKALVTATALTATATTALASTPDADQHLIDLFDEWRGLQRAILDATEKSDLASFAARKEYPKPPSNIFDSFNPENGGVMTRKHIELYYNQQRTIFNNNSDRAKTIYRERLAALNKLEADKLAINEKHNLAGLEKSLVDIIVKQKAVETELINTPAKGLTGVQVKLSLWAFWNLDDGIAENDFSEAYPYPESYAIKQALIDLQRLTGQTINAAS